VQQDDLVRPGPLNALTDVDGLQVGHAELTGDCALSGTTVVLAPPGGAVAGVDVRGAAPGTRETDLLDPVNIVARVHALVLTGGSAFGLAAADGVMTRLEAAGVGVPVPGGVVPIVPAAVVFDLGRGGDFGRRPGPQTGAAAYDAASSGPVSQGVCGAGAGALAGGLKGGIGTASSVLDGGATVAALVVVNAAGSAVDPHTGQLHGARFGLDGEFPALRPGPEAVAALRAAARHSGVAALRGAARHSRVAAPGHGPVADSAAHPTGPGLGTATSLVVVATDVTLDKAGCARLAAMGHDGLARALDPVHTVLDGDTVFGLATGAHAAPAPPALVALQATAAHTVSRAVAHALLAARTVTTPAGTYRCYRDLARNPG
jgi:L-aminopeptidase/D-esterase-like protein